MKGIYFCYFDFYCSTGWNIHSLRTQYLRKKGLASHAPKAYHGFIESYQNDFSLSWSFSLKAWNYFFWLKNLHSLTNCLKKTHKITPKQNTKLPILNHDTLKMHVFDSLPFEYVIFSFTFKAFPHNNKSQNFFSF